MGVVGGVLCCAVLEGKVKIHGERGQGCGL